jgi:EAL domain-containing protein (putative c-di-GMP-specific phosphodiesterase class I)/CheY-like chemotaxis protein
MVVSLRARERPIRVLVADDEAALRGALADLVGSDVELELVGAAADAEETITLANATHPDVVLVDVRMPKGGGLRVTEELPRRSPGTRILAHSAAEDRSTVVRILRGGAVGYLVKGTPPKEILAAIKHADLGLPTMSSDVVTGLVRDVAVQLERDEVRNEQRRTRLQRVSGAISGAGRTAVFQPIVELERRLVVGFEALARFDDDAWSVERWFEEARSLDLATELELACIATALGALPELDRVVYLAVNASHRTALDGSLLEALDGVDASRIVLEITEHEAVEDYERLAAGLAPLRERGARVAIDDAGAGFASLRHILDVDPDLIKLDVTLTRGVDRDRRRRALASALTSFADDMGITVVAEGIETAPELETLRSLGVRYGQGFALGRPAPLAAFGRSP